MTGFSRAVGGELWAMGSGLHQWETLFLLFFTVATPLQLVTTVQVGSREEMDLWLG